MNVDCRIREATPADAAAFARSQVDAWRAAYAGILPADYLAGLDVDRLTAGWERRLTGTAPGVKQFALCVGPDVVGWSGVRTPRDAVEDGVGELHAINVSPDHWSRGIGSALFSHSVRELAGLGYRRGYLWVAAGNTRAITFYARHGWYADGVSKEDHRFTPALHELRVVAASLC